VKEYLAACAVIDWDTPEVAEQARRLRAGLDDDVAIARAAFEWVRDAIHHSVDQPIEAVACSASEVLRLGGGLCYAKSHLLAALLRAGGVPAGLCYQRLSVDGQGAPFCLHGFNAVYLRGHGWYRIDARGNKPGVDAQFAPPREQLAFRTTLPGEQTFAAIRAEPLAAVVDVLRRYRGTAELCRHLPDAAPGEAFR
jgi:transglutaminase-like putative cysteine protease